MEPRVKMYRVQSVIVVMNFVICLFIYFFVLLLIEDFLSKKIKEIKNTNVRLFNFILAQS